MDSTPITPDQLDSVLTDAEANGHDKKEVLGELIKRGYSIPGYSTSPQPPQTYEQAKTAEIEKRKQEQQQPFNVLDLPRTLIPAGLHAAAFPGKALDWLSGEIAEQGGKAGYPPVVSALAGMVPETAVIAGGLPETTTEAVAVGAAELADKAELIPSLARQGVKAAEIYAPNITAGIKAAANLKIPLTKAEITGSKTWAMFESLMDRLPYSGETIRQFRLFRNNLLLDVRNRFLDSFGGHVESSDIGGDTLNYLKAHIGEIDESREKKLGRMRQTLLSRYGPNSTAANIGALLRERARQESKISADKLAERYAVVDKYAGENAHPLTNLSSAARGIQLEFKNVKGVKGDALRMLRQFSPEETGASEIPGFSSERLKKMIQEGKATVSSASKSEEAIKQMSFAQMRKQLSVFKQKIAESDAAIKGSLGGFKGQSSQEAGIYKRLAKALEGDMEVASAASGGEAKRAYDIATALAKKHYSLFDSDTMRRALRANPSELYDNFIKNGSVEDIRAIHKIVGDSSFAPARRLFMDDMLGQIARSEEIPDAEKAVARMSIYREEFLREMIGQPGIEQLKGFAKTGRLPEFVQSDVEKRIRRLIVAGVVPENIVRSVQSGKTSVALAVKKAVPPDVFKSLGRKVIEKMLGQDPMQAFSPAVVERNLKNIGDDYLNLWFSPTQIQDMRDIGKLSKVFNRASDVATQPSGTAMGLLAYHVGGLILSIPAAILGGREMVAAQTTAQVLGPQVLAHFYVSDTGRKLLNEGLGMELQNPEAAAIWRGIRRFSIMAEDSARRETAKTMAVGTQNEKSQ